MGNKQSAPAAPNPTQVANSQTASNKETAIAQANLNQVDQIGPGGSVKYSQIGTNSDGTPKYQQTTAYDPKTEGIYNAGLGTQQNLANTALEQSGRIGGLLNAPLDFSAQKQYLEGLTSGALDKSWANNQSALDTKLSNQGIKLGSDAYDRAQNQFGVTKSDAYNSANVSNYNTALQSQLALRAQPLNEIAALSSGSQIQQPQFGSVPQTALAGTDVSGITQQGYQNQLGAYNQAQQQQNNALGGLFGIGSSLLKLSDRRTKTNIEKVGETPHGTNVYEYNYKMGGPRQRGVMAQEVQDQPGAVHKVGKLMMVDYRKVK